MQRTQIGSKWQDDEGSVYHFGESVPNYTKVVPGAKVVFDRRDTTGTIQYLGYATIQSIEDLDEADAQDGRDKGYGEKIATLQDYVKFDPPRTRTPEIQKALDEVEKYNHQHSIRPITEEVFTLILQKNEGISQYGLNEFLRDTYQPESKVAEWEEILNEKKQIVFYGPPGTGKTFTAKKFAQYMVSKAGSGKVELVQFHPSYSYEDFVEGIKPLTENGQLKYEAQPGIFKKFCEAAEKDPDRNSKYILIIDEINRGSLSRIFGELIYGLEYRGQKDGKIQLQYSPDAFAIPDNVYIVGTMNSADRSIALVDYAIRRRFYFIELMPDNDILATYYENNPPLIENERLLKIFHDLNDSIKTESKLGPHYQIGHSYFMKQQINETKLSRMWNYSIKPIIEEYYMDDPEAVEKCGKFFELDSGS